LVQRDPTGQQLVQHFVLTNPSTTTGVRLGKLQEDPIDFEMRWQCCGVVW
jgi:hypothetical protein